MQEVKNGAVVDPPLIIGSVIDQLWDIILDMLINQLFLFNDIFLLRCTYGVA